MGRIKNLRLNASWDISNPPRLLLHWFTSTYNLLYTIQKYDYEWVGLNVLPYQQKDHTQPRDQEFWVTVEHGLVECVFQKKSASEPSNRPSAIIFKLLSPKLS